MQSIIDNPRAALGAGLALTAVLLLGGSSRPAPTAWRFSSFLVRLVHVLAPWSGSASCSSSISCSWSRCRRPTSRRAAFLHKAVVPSVAWWFRHASTVVVASGVLLLILAGYLLPSLVYGTGVYVPPARALLLWGGVIGGLAMWMFVHMYIWPNMQVVLGMRPGDDAAKARARARVVLFARLNLVLSLPVVFAMVAAAHLY